MELSVHQYLAFGEQAEGGEKNQSPTKVDQKRA